MSKKKHPAEQSETHAQKNVNLNTRGKNAAGQTNGKKSRMETPHRAVHASR